MDYPFLAFIIFSTIAILGSLLVVFKKNPVSSAFSLVLVFFASAGLYALMGAHFLAALQILVYTGAIMVLFVFVIMLLNQDESIQDVAQVGLVYKGVAILGSGGVLYLLIQTILRTRTLVATGSMTEEKIIEAGGNVRVISMMLFKDYVPHFELTSFLLLGAVVSTVALAKRKVTKIKREQTC